MSDNSIAYTLTLSFPNTIDSSLVTQVDYQVTSKPATPPLEPNQMPPCINVNDTLTFTYANANPGVQIISCLATQYNIESSTKESMENFDDLFDTPIPITDQFKGSWIFHLLGMFTFNNQPAAFYLDPEATFGPP